MANESSSLNILSVPVKDETCLSGFIKKAQQGHQNGTIIKDIPGLVRLQLELIKRKGLESNPISFETRLGIINIPYVFLGNMATLTGLALMANHLGVLSMAGSLPLHACIDLDGGPIDDIPDRGDDEITSAP